MTTNNQPHRIFLISPASAAGERARLILSERAGFDLAVRLRREGAALGEVFTFISGLYFRGKLAYACTFSRPPEGIPGAFVITAGRGLLTPETPITFDQLRSIAAVPIDAADPRYRGPLERDAAALRDLAGENCEYVLLGSIATAKYMQPLCGVFSDRLLIPAEFAGRGDMSRGGLLLRCARAGVELNYVPAIGAPLRGPRPPKLPKLR